MIKRAFDPVVDDRTRLLILGSLPGDASLAAGEYYAHPTNGFWKLIGDVIERDVSAQPYGARIAMLREAGIGLWDVVRRARRVGSLDAAIRAPEAADLDAFLAGYPAIAAVAFNGKTASRLGRAAMSDANGPLLVDLPSSSAAHAISWSDKVNSWRRLRAFLT